MGAVIFKCPLQAAGAPLAESSPAVSDQLMAPSFKHSLSRIIQTQ